MLICQQSSAESSIPSILAIRPISFSWLSVHATHNITQINRNWFKSLIVLKYKICYKWKSFSIIIPSRSIMQFHTFLAAKSNVLCIVFLFSTLSNYPLVWMPLVENVFMVDYKTIQTSGILSFMPWTKDHLCDFESFLVISEFQSRPTISASILSN